MHDNTLYLYFDGLERSVRLTGSQHLTEYFAILFPEWEYHLGHEDDNPVISLQFDKGVYQLSTAWDKAVKQYADKVDTLCALIADLALAMSLSDLQALHLHAASVVKNDKLIVFPSQRRAGKSFLTACLVAEGYRYSGDDVLPVTLGNGQGRSPGFALRLRSPLPATTDEKSRCFIEQQMAIQGKRYAYLNLDNASRVARNELYDIGAFVLLERRDGVAAYVEELPASIMFKQLIKQNYARELDGTLILSTLTRAISQAQCIKIYYDRADDAVCLLNNHFSSWPEQVNNGSEKGYTFALQNNNPELMAQDCLIQNEGVSKVTIDSESFLTSPDGQSIYHLDTIASGVWSLLSEPMTKEDVISVLSTAFPAVEPSVLEKDTAKILSALQHHSLIHMS